MSESQPTLDAITEADIDKATLIDDLDDAIRTLQDIAGITDGGVAALCFDYDEWAKADTALRKVLINEWILVERSYF